MANSSAVKNMLLSQNQCGSQFSRIHIFPLLVYCSFDLKSNFRICWSSHMLEA